MSMTARHRAGPEAERKAPRCPSARPTSPGGPRRRCRRAPARASDELRRRRDAGGRRQAERRPGSGCWARPVARGRGERSIPSPAPCSTWGMLAPDTQRCQEPAVPGRSLLSLLVGPIVSCSLPDRLRAAPDLSCPAAVVPACLLSRSVWPTGPGSSVGLRCWAAAERRGGLGDGTCTHERLPLRSTSGLRLAVASLGGGCGRWRGSRLAGSGSGIVGTIARMWSARGVDVQAAAPRSGGRSGSDAALTPTSTCGKCAVRRCRPCGP